MSLIATLRIYTGRQDPSWPLPAADESAIRNWQASRKFQRSSRETGQASRMQTGYVGFELRDPASTDSSAIVIAPASTGLLAGSDDVQRIDHFLFRSIPPALRDRFRLSLDDLETRSPVPIDRLPPRKGVGYPKCGSTVHPDRSRPWNHSSFVTKNRCYNWATNTLFEAGHADPGERFDWTADQLIADCVAGGFECLGGNLPGACDGSGAYFVLACLDGTDYHFFRLDADGTWSHKPGSFPTSELDDVGRCLTNLDDARFQARYTFVAYLIARPQVRRRLCARYCRQERELSNSDCRTCGGDAFASADPDVVTP